MIDYTIQSKEFCIKLNLSFAYSFLHPFIVILEDAPSLLASGSFDNSVFNQELLPCFV